MVGLSSLAGPVCNNVYAVGVCIYVRRARARVQFHVLMYIEGVKELHSNTCSCVHYIRCILYNIHALVIVPNGVLVTYGVLVTLNTRTPSNL